MKKWHIPDTLEWRLVVKNPTGNRKTFGVIKRAPVDDGGFTTVTVHSPTLDSINARYTRGDLDRTEARKEVDLFIEAEYRKAGAVVFKEVSNNENHKLVEQYIAKKYRNSRSKYGDAGRKAGYRRVALALGQVSLQSGNEGEIGSALDSAAMNRAKGDITKFAKIQRRLIGDARVLLTWLKRTDIELTQEPEPAEEVKALTKNELLKMIQYLPSEAVRVAHLMAFYTGCRMAELLALDVGALNKKNETIRITKAYHRDGTWGLPKGRKPRTALIYEEGIALYAKWLSLKDEVHPLMNQLSKMTRKACTEAFPGDESRNIKFHDLRHSYAQRMVADSIPIKYVADSIGDTVEVCTKHYAGTNLKDDSIEMIKLHRAEARRLREEEGIGEEA